MRIKTGIDIIEVERVQENIERFGDRFLNRVFTENEIEYCESKNMQKFQSYSGRFATKEAVFKAISGLLNNKFDVKWKDIEVLNDETGRPKVKLGDTLRQVMGENIKIDVSISHVANTAVASAVAQIES